ncbi:hypothetical protein ACQ4LE_005326 [Meloidogyne hapla]
MYDADEYPEYRDYLRLKFGPNKTTDELPEYKEYLKNLQTSTETPKIRLFSRRLDYFPRRLDYFLDSYRQATRENYSYLFIDLHPSSDPSLRLRTNIFDFASEKKDSDNFETTIFLPKTNN